MDVWIGVLASREAFDSYLEETYSSEPETDHLPIDAFAGEQGETFNEHDSFECSFHYTKRSLAALFKGHSFIDQFQEKAVKAWHAQRAADANSLFLLWGRQVEAPVSVSAEDYQLIYLGRFNCTP